MFSKGDYVVYEPGYKSELGRVTKVNLQTGKAWVCYNEGCTASCTNLSDLRAATPQEIEANKIQFGFHRFDASCPSYDPDICEAYCTL